MKYVFFNAQSQLSEYSLFELKTRNDVIWYKSPNSRLLRGIRDLHTSIRANSIVPLPFKRIWYNSLTTEMLDSQERYVFVFEEGNKFSYDFSYLRYLRRKYDKSKCVFLFLNPAEFVNATIRESIMKSYDLILSFNKNDCESYGYTHYSGIYSRMPIVPDADIPTSDVFFVGNNKNRLHEIIEMYHYLCNLGLQCIFFISEVPESEIRDYPGIHFNDFISYETVIKYVQKTKCVLEILQKNQDGSSLRAMEALVYERKLITNNLRIKDERFFNPRQMLAYKDISDISTSFLEDVGGLRYDGIVSPNLFLDWLKTNLQL